MSEMTLEKFVEEAKRLRREADDAEHHFMEFLCWAEEQDFWRDAGLTFEQLLSRHHICRPERFLGYKRTFKTVGAESTKAVGVHAAVAAGKLGNEAQVQEFLSEARTWEETNQTSMSEQSAGRLLRDMKVRASASRKHKSRESLANENERLRAKLEELKQENAALRKENRELKKQLKQAGLEAA